MALDPSAPITQMPGGIWLQRVAGLIATTAGAAFGALFLLAANKTFFEGQDPDAIQLAAVGMLGAITALLLSAGLRMLFNIANRYGSLLTPGTWYLLAAVFFVGAVLLAVQSMRTDAALFPVKPILYAALFGVFASWAGVRAKRKSG